MSVEDEPEASAAAIEQNVGDLKKENKNGVLEPMLTDPDLPLGWTR